MSQLKATRIGPKMMIALAFIMDHPGCPKIDPALAAEPYPWKGMRGGLSYGYRSVNRCIDVGLVAAEWLGSKWSLELTDKGRAVIG